jgi:TonB-linked SusC/RagA family outer membrane protein
MPRARLLLVALLAGLSWAGPLGAQQVGEVAGRVVDAATQQPLANVTVTAAERSALTGADGRFRLTGVPAGTHTVRASRLGYDPATQRVTVAAGQTAVVQIAMSVQAVAVEGVVVVGYGEQRRRDVTGVVETVSPETFNRGRIVSPEQLIQGKVAGVQVIDSGEPGSGVSLRIRGGTSVNASNEPLFVIDGVPLPVGGGLSAGRNPLNFLNPEDIASITVLKDASATAIYGSRGANGVVIIETRTAEQGPGMTYTGSFSGSSVTREPDLLTAEQFRAVMQERAPDKLALLGTANTDWRDAVQRSAYGQQHNLAFTGSTDEMGYRLSLGFLEQDGVVLGSTTERASASLNYTHRLLADRLTIEAHALGSRTEDQFTPGGVLGSATAFAPTQPIRTDDGFFEWRDFPLAPNNPLAELALAVEEGSTYRSIGNVQGRYRAPFLEGLAATTRLSYDVAKSERLGFFPSTMQSQIESPPSGVVNRSQPTEVTTVVDAFLNYVRPIGRAGSDLDATAGYSYERSTGDYPFFQARGLSSDLLGPSGIPAAEEEITRINEREGRLASFFGRVNYDLLDRYVLTLSVRRDGSSKFGPGNQWGTFPSAAVAWRASEESFLRDVSWLSDLKLRASWGINGNQSFGDYLWVSAYRFGDESARVQFGDEFVNTIRPSAVDPNIKWEETTSYNLGFDYSVLADRVSGSVDYYHKDTEDLIFNVPVAAGTNLSNFVTTNIGSVRNQGVELSLNARMIQDHRGGGLTWDAGFNASANRNELKRINAFGGGAEQILVGGISGGVGTNIQVLQPGFSINSFFVYRHKRDASGRPIYADTNGDGTINEQDLYIDLNDDGIINQEDRAPFHSPSPDWAFGHTSTVGYGSFDMSLSLRAQLGNRVYNNVASNWGNYRELTAIGAPVNLHASVLETGFETPQYFSDFYVEDGSFLRMDNITVGYTFAPPRASRQMRVFGTVQNVFTITGYDGIDPMAGLNGIDNNIYPRSRTFTGGVSVGF